MGLSVIHNAVKILLFIADNGYHWRIREISCALNLPKSTVHRTCQLLAGEGLLEFDQNVKQYQWGPKLVYIAQHIHQNNQIRQFALPILQRIVNECNETAILTLYNPKEYQIMFVDQVQCNQPIRYHIPLGIPLPIHAGAGGRAIMAFLPGEVIERIIGSGLQRITDLTLTNPSRLKTELVKIKAHGYAFSHGEVTPEAIGFASPVFNGNATVIASLLITLPSYRFREKLSGNFIKLVKGGSEQLSRIMGRSSNNEQRFFKPTEISKKKLDVNHTELAKQKKQSS